MKVLATIVFVVPIFALLMLGFVNFGRISRAANIPYVGPSSAIRIYKHAFTELRSSRETKYMVLGFLGAVLWPVVGGLLFALVAPMAVR